jgi:hypothetical protein
MNKFKRLVFAIWCAFLVILMPVMAEELMHKRWPQAGEKTP